MKKGDIERINELARKAKTVGLTPEENEERAKLRRAYIDSVVGDLRQQLDNTYIVDAKGNKIAHTIDPRTGRSAVSRLLSVTVVAPTCAEADALGTMFLAMGADDALAAAKSMPQMKVYFILADGADAYEEYVSPAMEAVIMQ
ncbi:MAG: DUF896 domain-containing protein [Alistipes onderdonkii]|nr:DUF896 domain-containing protein [Alistipes onderdonkii]